MCIFFGSTPSYRGKIVVQESPVRLSIDKATAFHWQSIDFPLAKQRLSIGIATTLCRDRTTAGEKPWRRTHVMVEKYFANKTIKA